MKENRLREVRLRMSDVAKLINFVHRENPVQVPVLESDPPLPGDIIVVSIAPNFTDRTLNFIIGHESFEPVPEGQTIPRYPNEPHLVEMRGIEEVAVGLPFSKKVSLLDALKLSIASDIEQKLKDGANS